MGAARSSESNKYMSIHGFWCIYGFWCINVDLRIHAFLVCLSPYVYDISSDSRTYNYRTAASRSIAIE